MSGSMSNAISRPDGSFTFPIARKSYEARKTECRRPGYVRVCLISLALPLVDLGAGLWLNLAMFGTVAIAYGIATMKVAARLGAERG
jgi:hypothetical protein